MNKRKQKDSYLISVNKRASMLKVTKRHQLLIKTNPVQNLLSNSKIHKKAPLFATSQRAVIAHVIFNIFRLTTTWTRDKTTNRLRSDWTTTPLSQECLPEWHNMPCKRHATSMDKCCIEGSFHYPLITSVNDGWWKGLFTY